MVHAFIIVRYSSVLKSVLRTSDDFASSVSGEADFSKRFDGGLGEFMPDKMEEMTGEDEDVEYDLDMYGN